MKNKTRFYYSTDASSFLSERIDESPDYKQATDVFEYFVSRNRNAGFIVGKWEPLSPLCFVVKLSGLKKLAFFYYYSKKSNLISISVFAIEFAP